MPHATARLCRRSTRRVFIIIFSKITSPTQNNIKIFPRHTLDSYVVQLNILKIWTSWGMGSLGLEPRRTPFVFFFALFRTTFLFGGAMWLCWTNPAEATYHSMESVHWSVGLRTAPEGHYQLADLIQENNFAKELRVKWKVKGNGCQITNWTKLGNFDNFEALQLGEFFNIYPHQIRHPN